MKVTTEIRDARLSYEGLGKLVSYVNGENREVRLSGIEYHPVTDREGDYFSVSVTVPGVGAESERIVGYINSLEIDRDPKLKGFLNYSIRQLDLTFRAQFYLERAKIKTVAELANLTEAELLKIRSFGETSLREVKRKLTDLGLTLGMKPAE